MHIIQNMTDTHCEILDYDRALNVHLERHAHGYPWACSCRSYRSRGWCDHVNNELHVYERWKNSLLQNPDD